MRPCALPLLTSLPRPLPTSPVRPCPPARVTPVVPALTRATPCLPPPHGGKRQGWGRDSIRAPTPAPHLSALALPSRVALRVAQGLSPSQGVSSPLRGVQVVSGGLSGSLSPLTCSHVTSCPLAPSGLPSALRSSLGSPQGSGLTLGVVATLRGCVSPRGQGSGSWCVVFGCWRTSVRSGRNPMGGRRGSLPTGAGDRGRPNFKILRFPVVQIDLSEPLA